MIASLESLIVNIVRQLYSPKGRAPAFANPSEFMIKWGEVVEEKKESSKQTPEEMRRILERIAGTMVNKIKSKRDDG